MSGTSTEARRREVQLGWFRRRTSESAEVRNATLVVLKASERLLTVAQRATERVSTRLRLRLRAWQLALDPGTKTWIKETKEALAAGALEGDAVDDEEAVRRREQARRNLSA